MHIRELLSDEHGTWRLVCFPEEGDLYVKYDRYDEESKPADRMIDDFLFTLPRSAGHQRAADAPCRSDGNLAG